MDVVEENKGIVIGGQTVVPGEEKLLSISIDRLPTGTLIDIPVYVFNAKKPGPTILVQAGLHGDEINGIEIVRRMIAEKRFKINKGAVIAVPILNIFGFIHFSRDVPDGKDVNRSFPGTKTGSMASRIAYHYVTEIMHQIDYGIDLHTGGGQRHNFPQIRYTGEDVMSCKLAEVFNAPISFSSKLIRGSFRNAAFVSSVAACPSTASPKSPGKSSIELKMIIETKNNVIRPRPKRWSTVLRTGCTIFSPNAAFLVRTTISPPEMLAKA